MSTICSISFFNITFSQFLSLKSFKFLPCFSLCPKSLSCVWLFVTPWTDLWHWRQILHWLSYKGSLWPTRLLYPWHSSGKNTGVGSQPFPSPGAFGLYSGVGAPLEKTDHPPHISVFSNACWTIPQVQQLQSLENWPPPTHQRLLQCMLDHPEGPTIAVFSLLSLASATILCFRYFLYLLTALTPYLTLAFSEWFQHSQHWKINDTQRCTL